MIKVMIKCPECNETGHIKVKNNLIEDNERGITAINVTERLICKHSFIAYIDNNFTMRDAFISDFKVTLPDIRVNDLIEKDGEESSNNIDLYLLSLNLPALTLTYILYAFLHNIKVSLINDLNIINSQLLKFFQYIFQNSFKFDISFQSRSSYRNNQKKYKEYIVIDKNEIINNGNNHLINLKQIKIEKAIIQKFLSELDPKVSLIILKNEVQKAYNLSKEIILLNQNLKETEELTSRIMIDHFERAYRVKMGKEYLDFLTRIVMNYFNIKFKQAKGASDLVKYF